MPHTGTTLSKRVCGARAFAGVRVEGFGFVVSHLGVGL
jgi:hypothetical protein